MFRRTGVKLSPRRTARRTDRPLPAPKPAMPTAPAVILLVDDHRAVREELAFQLTFDGYLAREAPDGPTGLAMALDPAVDLMVLDVKLPGMDGLEVLAKAKEARPELPVVMISGHGDLETAVLAVRRGAYDFLQKPFGKDRLVLSLQNALAASRLARENAALRQALARDHELLGDSAVMQRVRATIAKLAPTDVATLVTGENGVGKELAARQLHLQSGRADGPFVARNCAAIPQDLVESELFGHERGAFTGAMAPRAGAFEQAHGGTLFLDEVGDMPLPMQAKLLRALQERRVQRLGASKELPVDVRIVAATNQDLAAMVAAKTFREDLYYRLHGVRVHLPPLRERPEDLGALAAHFLAGARARHGLPPRRLGGDAAGWLAAQPWPGNVRQLRNVVEAAVVLADGEEIGARELQAALSPAPARDAGGADWFAFERLEDFKAATEKEFLRRKLLEFGGNIKRTAERIELMRSNLYKKLERYGLK
jgi:two-component system nitrogen regulation response regulator NtrX